jgi:hypothetical protein
MTESRYCVYGVYGESAILWENVTWVKLQRYDWKYLYPNLDDYRDNSEASFKECKLLYTYWLPNMYKYEKEFVVHIMLTPVCNI